jgi:hypothetical protein
MLEARVLTLIGAALVRLKRHPPRKCESDPTHGEVSPELGSLELTIPAPDAAVYTCANERCGWRRFEKLKPAEDATPQDVAEQFTVNGRHDDTDDR